MRLLKILSKKNKFKKSKLQIVCKREKQSEKRKFQILCQEIVSFDFRLLFSVECFFIFFFYVLLSLVSFFGSVIFRDYPKLTSHSVIRYTSYMTKGPRCCCWCCNLMTNVKCVFGIELEMTMLWMIIAAWWSTDEMNKHSWIATFSSDSKTCPGLSEILSANIQL